MKVGKIFLSVTFVVSCVVALASTAHATYVYDFFTNSDTGSDLAPFLGDSATTYYDYSYSKLSGDPAFGPQEGEAFFWLYEEIGTGQLSLSVIFSEYDGNATGAGEAYFNISGAPLGASWTLVDDHYETPGAWSWSSTKTDGGVLGGLEDSSWMIDFNLTALEGIDTWHFLSGDSVNPDDNVFTLAVGDTLTVRATDTDPVPEPATMLLFGVGVVGLAGLRKRK